MSTLKSPGILINERAEEFQPTGTISPNLTVIMGEFDNGEAFVPRRVNLAGLKKFYDSKDSFAYLTAKKILEEDEEVIVSRITNNDISTQILKALKIPINDSGSGVKNFIIGLGGKLNGLDIDFAELEGVTLTSNEITIELIGTAEDDPIIYSETVSLTSTADNYIFNLPNEYGNNNLFLMYGDDLESFTPAAIGEVTALTYNYTNKSSQAFTPYIMSNESVPNKMFRIKTRSVGSNLNKKYKVEISNIDTDEKTFDLHIREFGDSYKYKSKLESFFGLNLDPDSSNYICKRIGDEYSEIGTDGYLKTKGDFTNLSDYIYIVPENSLKNGNFKDLVPAGFHSMQNPFSATGGIADDDLSVINNAIAHGDNGYDFENNYQILIPLPDNTPDAFGFGYLNETSVDNYLIDPTNNYQTTNGFLVPLTGGYDGSLIIKEYNNLTASNICGFDFNSHYNDTEPDPDSENNPGYIAFNTALKILSNFDQYDFEKIVVNLPYSLCSTLIKRAISFCQVERKTTAFVIFDTTTKDASFTETDAKEMATDLDTTYGFCNLTNWYKVIDGTKTRFVPESCLLPKAFSQNDNIANLYSAPAFVNRGRITDAISVGTVLTNEERDYLYENGINPTKVVRDYGITLYGHRTPTRRDVVTREIQVRRVSNYIKRYIASQTELVLGEANTDETKNLFRSRIEPFLNGIVANGGLDRYELSFGTNTPQNRNTLFVELYIFPPSAINFVQLNISISIDNTTVEEV